MTGLSCRAEWIDEYSTCCLHLTCHSRIIEALSILMRQTYFLSQHNTDHLHYVITSWPYCKPRSTAMIYRRKHMLYEVTWHICCRWGDGNLCCWRTPRSNGGPHRGTVVATSSPLPAIYFIRVRIWSAYAPGGKSLQTRTKMDFIFCKDDFDEGGDGHRIVMILLLHFMLLHRPGTQLLQYYTINPCRPSALYHSSQAGGNIRLRRVMVSNKRFPKGRSPVNQITTGKHMAR